MHTTSLPCWLQFELLCDGSKVSSDGTPECRTMTPSAFAGPKFCTVTEYVAMPPLETEFGPEFEMTARSDWLLVLLELLDDVEEDEELLVLELEEEVLLDEELPH